VITPSLPSHVSRILRSFLQSFIRSVSQIMGHIPSHWSLRTPRLARIRIPPGLPLASMLHFCIVGCVSRARIPKSATPPRHGLSRLRLRQSDDCLSYRTIESQMSRLPSPGNAVKKAL
jgi:hypothetical protein